MKKYSTLILSALSALALGGCAGTSALTTSTEDDGVYYTSKDKTTLTPAAQEALDARYGQEQTNGGYAVSGDVNPEYAGDGSTQDANGTAEYYDDDYGYASRLRRFNSSTYSGLGYSSLAYTDPFWYGGYSPYSYGSLYSPFYSPYYGSGLSIGLGVGFGSIYRPYGLGYGGLGYGGLYDPFYSPYYGGIGYGGLGYGLGYGGLGYGGLGYGYPYYGGSYGYGNGDVRGRLNARPRSERSAAALSSTPNTAVRGGRMGGNATLSGAGNTGYSNGGVPNFGGRTRGRVVNAGTVQAAQQQNAAGVPADQPRLDNRGSRRWNSQAQSAYSNQNNTAQPRRNRMFGGDVQQQQQQVYRQPTRSYEQPTQSFSQPSRSSSSFGGSSGGSMGGGGGRGRVR